MGEEARAYVSLEDLLRLRHRAKGFSFLPRQPVHSLLVGRHASKLRGRGLDFEELRHYFEGDDTRTIDWAATARLGTPHVRVYTEERDRSVLLVVDQRLSMFFGSRRATKSVIAAEAAALAAWRVVSLGDRVGAVIFSENGCTEIRPQARERAAMRIIGALVKQNNSLKAGEASPANPSLFNDALKRAGRLTTHDCLICLVTDAYGADEETVKIVTKLTAHNDVLTIFVHDPLEAELPQIGRVVVAEANNRIELNTSDPRLRSRFAVSFQARRDQIVNFSRERAIPVLPISTERDAGDQLRALIGERIVKFRQGANVSRTSAQ